MLQPLISPLISNVPWVQHGFFTRRGGASVGVYESLNLATHMTDDPDHVSTNHQRVADWFGLNSNQFIIAHQQHGVLCQKMDAFNLHQARPKCDALKTHTPSIALGVITADCVPVLLVDLNNRWIASIHVGWRGAVGGIIAQTLQRDEQHTIRKPHIIAAIGPSIQQPSYEVSRDIYNQFTCVQDSYSRFFQTHTSQTYLFDLPGLVYTQLQQSGVVTIDWLRIDTYTNDQLFFSCRRNAHQGLKNFGDMASVIMLKQQ